MTRQYKLDYKSPIGILEIVGSEEVISSIMFTERDKIVNVKQDETPKVLVDCMEQLHEYFKGSRYVFTFPYILEGTNFQKRVWNALTLIPYAETGSYKEIAALIQNEKAIRAVGSANGKNLISIVIPCHRVIGSNATLTGYAGGLWRKEWLLQHEKSFNKS